MADVPSHAFASDNAAPAHPKMIDAIVKANAGAVASYGNDDATRRAAEAVKAAFDSPTPRCCSRSPARRPTSSR